MAELYDAAAHEPLTEREWDVQFVEERIRAIVAEAEDAFDGVGWPVHPRDEGDDLFSDRPASLYLGAAGMVWALGRLGTSLDLAATAAEALRRQREQPDFGPEDDGLHFGETGVLLVAHLAGVPGLENRLGELVKGNMRNEAWELMTGSAGSMIAARVMGLDSEADASAAVLAGEWDEATGLWTQTLGGKAGSYLGPAHGLVGNVHALRGFLSDDDLRARLEPALRREAHVEGGFANWPPRVGDTLTRLQWCHGAAGIVATVGDLMPRDLLVSGAELTWRAGPLAKGPGLCHGTAGNGYAFLRTYAVTGDDVWLERARGFAMHALEQVEGERGRVGRGRYTLYTGDVGAALFAQSCLAADDRFPTMDVW